MPAPPDAPPPSPPPAAGASVLLARARPLPPPQSLRRIRLRRVPRSSARSPSTRAPNLIHNAPRISHSRIFVDGAELKAEITPAAASITRFDLDIALWDSCAQAGVELRDDCAVQSVKGTGPFHVATRPDSFEARAIINATGRWSNFTSPVTRARVTKAEMDRSQSPFPRDLRFPRRLLSISTSSTADTAASSPSAQIKTATATAVNACAMVRADVATDMHEVLQLHPALRERSQTWQLMIGPREHLAPGLSPARANTKRHAPNRRRRHLR